MTKMLGYEQPPGEFLSSNFWQFEDCASTSQKIRHAMKTRVVDLEDPTDLLLKLELRNQPGGS